MAVRSPLIRSLDGTRTTATVAIATLFGMFGPSSAEAARRQWEDEPAASVLVESGMPYDGQAMAEGGLVEPGMGNAERVIEGGGEPEYEAFAFSGDGCCSSCTGVGCDQCCPEALIDTRCHEKKACWIGRVDALLLWRNAPPDRPLIDNGLVVGPLLNANGMDSTAAAGPRFSLFRVNNCTGHALEATYLRAANFRSIRPLSAVSAPYTLEPPGIFGNATSSFANADANLGSRLQSFELNRHHCVGQHLRFLAGFRWIEWQEQFTLQGTSAPGAGSVTDFYQTNCFNDLYGGQIGLDANLLATPWLRFDGLVKAGVYYNNAVQSSQYSTTNPNNPGSATVAVNESPLSGAFAGEVGLTGVMPITRNIDVRLGYFGLWLSGIAQPTQQLSGQQLTPGQPVVGTINANGGVLVQGVSLGLEGRW
jgi:hypothetical protein